MKTSNNFKITNKHKFKTNRENKFVIKNKTSTIKTKSVIAENNDIKESVYNFYSLIIENYFYLVKNNDKCFEYNINDLVNQILLLNKILFVIVEFINYCGGMNVNYDNLVNVIYINYIKQLHNEKIIKVMSENKSRFLLVQYFELKNIMFFN